MFKKLKLKFILTNVLTSTAVLVIAFSSIYLVAKNTSSQRQLKPVSESSASSTDAVRENPATSSYENAIEQFNKEMNERIDNERKESLNTLLISLIVSGVAVEAIITLLSLYLAEEAIKPVRSAYQAQKDFIANASHEIKTPLAVIQANLEAADIKGNKWLDNVAEKAEDLAELNNQLLDLARSESFAEEIKTSEVDLKKLTMSCIDAFEPKAAEQGKTITTAFSLPDGYKVKLNRKAFEQILNIYIDNGIKYSKKVVSVNAKKDRVSVISDGKMIAESKLPHLFDRFYQADKSSEGVGLGLAIAKSVAEKNGWKVYASVDKENKTNVFTLEFR